MPLADHQRSGLALDFVPRKYFGCQVLFKIYEEFSPRTWVLLNIFYFLQLFFLDLFSSLVRAIAGWECDYSLALTLLQVLILL